jgi:hypothetical protein
MYARLAERASADQAAGFFRAAALRVQPFVQANGTPFPGPTSITV